MGITAIKQSFSTKRNENKNLFIPYIMAGDGGLDQLAQQIEFLESCGVAAIELGIPFSDPVADGPTVQAAGERSLANGTTLTKILTILKETKEKRSVPIILMTYLNPVYKYGIEDFAKDCQASGVAGAIIPDLPLEEEKLITDVFQKHSIAFIRLVALTSTEERIKEICRRAEGFIYAVSVTGTTGARTTHGQGVEAYLQTIKQASDVPVLAGFGVSSPEQAKSLSAACDGVIVGSKIVDLLHQEKYSELKELIEKSL